MQAKLDMKCAQIRTYANIIVNTTLPTVSIGKIVEQLINDFESMLIPNYEPILMGLIFVVFVHPTANSLQIISS